MYTVDHNKEQNYLEIKKSNKSLYAKIYLSQGASLQELKLNGHKIIKDLSPLEYGNTYASSILFPFANRIKDGRYTFNGTLYQLEQNQREEQNALHGFVYDKTFDILEINSTKEFASVKLVYIESSKTKGFPFTFIIEVDYMFYEDKVELSVSVKNTSDEVFPFTLGWHPYFTSANLYNSSIAMESNKKLDIGERNITKGVHDIDLIDNFEIQDKQLDDCWILNSNKVVFNTPEYKLQIQSSAHDNFLQAYTPEKENTIAIEPTTGVSDSFNNKIGLQELEPDETYSITWDIKII